LSKYSSRAPSPHSHYQGRLQPSAIAVHDVASKEIVENQRLPLALPINPLKEGLTDIKTNVCLIGHMIAPAIKRYRYVFCQA
jgi:hypothetical protein